MLIYNLTKKAFFLKDFGGVKIQPKSVFDTEKQKILDSEVEKASVSGHLSSAIDAGILVIKTKPVILKTAPTYASYEQEKFNHTRRVKLITKVEAGVEDDFIALLQSEFGDKILQKSDEEISKNTEKLINSIDFDGFNDPLNE